MPLLSLAISAAVAVGYAVANPDRVGAAAMGFVVGAIGAGGLWLNGLRRRAFDPQTPEDVAKAPDRQAAMTAATVWGVVGVGAVLAIWALADWLTG